MDSGSSVNLKTSTEAVEPRNRNPSARFSKLSEKLRQVTPDDLQCSMFCGGKKCKYESDTFWDSKDMAINGVYSHWVTNDILACARPNTNSIEKFNIIDQFKRANIKSIINLQSRGEHGKCGGTLDESGFSYNPQVFMNNNIFFYNFAIKDYGVASRDFMLDMVKVMSFSMVEGKVAIHCHAGLGRTGVLIACYLVYALRVRANDAIRYVRIKRPNSIQTRTQILCVQDFSHYVAPSFIIFPQCNEKCGVTLKEYLQRQNRILHGYEARDLKYIPKLIHVVCERLLQLCHCQESDSLTSGHRLIQQGTIPFWKSYISANSIDDSYNSSLDSNKDENILMVISGKKGLHKHPNKTLTRGVSSPALMAWSSPVKTNNKDELRSTTPLDRVLSNSGNSLKTEVMSLSEETTPYGSWDQDSVISEVTSMLEVSLDDTDSLLSVSSTTSDLGGSDKMLSVDVTQNPCFKELTYQDELRNELDKNEKIESTVVVAPLILAEDLAKLMLSLEEPAKFPTDLNQRCNQLQEELNTKSTAWIFLQRETDSRVLIAIFISWFYVFKKPILSDLVRISTCEKQENIVDILGQFSTINRFLVEYLARFVHRLRPLSEGTRNGFIEWVADLLIQNDSHKSTPVNNKTFVVKTLEKILKHISGQDVGHSESPVSR